MIKTGFYLLFLIVLLTMLPVHLHAASLDCPGGIIATGDSRLDLVMKCGEPDAKESHDEEIIDRSDPGMKRKVLITVEAWTYNFGPAQFLRIVTLRNGTVSDIRTGNYGYSKETKQEQHECSESIVSPGDLKTEVLAKCGEPTIKEVRQEASTEKLDARGERVLYITIEEWTYNLGPNRFVRILTFRNGKLKDIRTGGYGYPLKEEEKRKTP